MYLPDTALLLATASFSCMLATGAIRAAVIWENTGPKLTALLPAYLPMC